jgi:glutamyl-tRNA reductase
LGSLDSIVAFAVRHKRVGSEVVGRLQGLAETVEEKLAPLSRGLVVLATCHRLEVYLDTEEPGEARRALEAILPPEAAGGLEEFRGLSAVTHLMEVSAGLDSEIIGEHEILGQVRRAWLRAKSRGLTTWLLDQVFHRALVAGRRVRSETGIAQGHVGYPEVAVEIASERLGGLDGKRVALVGAGDAGRGIAVFLCSRFKPSLFTVYNRSVEKARSVAELCGGEARGLNDLRAMPEVDVLFVAVAGGYKLPVEAVEMAGLVVDISNPPAAPRAPNVVGFEEVTRVASERIRERMRWIPAAKRIVSEEVEALLRLLGRTRGDAAASLIMRYAYSLIEREVQATLRNLERGADPREALEIAFSSYARKILHPLLAALRKASIDGAPEVVEFVAGEYARRLERLEEAEVQA